MTTKFGTAQEWQDFLDAKFPNGAQVNAVLPDGTLAAVVYNLPYIVVMEMQDDKPILLGVDMWSDHSLSLFVEDWEELDRDGHYIARVDTGEDKRELSTWLSPNQIQSMAAARSEHVQILQEASYAFQNGEITGPGASVAV